MNHGRNLTKFLFIFRVCKIVCISTVFVLFLSAQNSAQFRFDVWRIDNGLPQNSVNDILQTRDGYLWLTTNGGLVRYNGVKFIFFDSGNTKGLKETRFAKLFEDRDGVLWITTENSGLVKYKARVFSTYITDAAKTTEQLEEISAATDEAIDEVTEISYNLRPFQLDKLGLTKAVESMVKKISSASDIQFITNIDDVNNLFAPEEEINFYRIVQESVNNIVKHSKATQAEVKILRSERSLDLIIRDNGIGFDPNREALNSDKKGGFGLIGIAERARILGGKYQVQSLSGSGTTVILKIDLNKSNADGN